VDAPSKDQKERSSDEAETPQEFAEALAREPVIDEAPAAPEPDEAAILELKRQLDAEKAARLQERQAREAAEQAARAARSETDDTNLRLVENALETVKANLKDLKRTYAEAAAVGDWDRAAEAQEHIARAAKRAEDLETGKQAMQAEAKRPTRPAASTATDPVERMVADWKLTPRSADWVRKHPEFASDTNLQRKMVAAHNLVASDYVPDSDAYFDAIEEVLKVNKTREPRAEEGETFSDAAAPVQRRSPPAAPVSRQSVSGSGSAPGQVRLTAQEAEMAKLTGLTAREYWEQKQRIARETQH
jgi:hypothetical protein